MDYDCTCCKRSIKATRFMVRKKLSLVINFTTFFFLFLTDTFCRALSQLLVISPSSIVSPFQTESFLTYYDIFVRNAFGNYYDILKEVSYSPMMAEMLSFLDSKSAEYVWKEQKEVQFADENFAREILQLFTIGLVKLNIDGTKELDSNGNTIPTYNNDDITEYARVWTG